MLTADVSIFRLCSASVADQCVNTMHTYLNGKISGLSCDKLNDCLTQQMSNDQSMLRNPVTMNDRLCDQAHLSLRRD